MLCRNGTLFVERVEDGTDAGDSRGGHSPLHSGGLRYTYTFTEPRPAHGTQA
jgi:hypothetical protein